MRRYGQLLRTPSVAMVLAVSLVARLPVSMYSLAILLAVQARTGSLTDAGIVGASAAIGYAVTGPPLGRAVDRYGAPRPLLLTAALNLFAFVSFVFVLTTSSAGGVYVGWLSAGAFAIGASIPPVTACQRTCWRRLLPDRDGLRDTAFALDSLSMDFYLVAGPVAVAATASWFAPESALVLSGVLMTGGAIGFALLPVIRRMSAPMTRVPANRPRDRAAAMGPLRSIEFRVLVATIAAAGAALGLIRVGLVGAATDGGDADRAGIFYAAIGIGSAVAGFWYGGRHWNSAVRTRYPVLLAAYAIGAAILVPGGSVIVVFVLALITGLALSPTTIGEFALVGEMSPAGTTAEGFAWATTATFAGSALGTSLGGWLAQQAHWRLAIVVAAVLLAGAAAIAYLCLSRPRRTSVD